MRKIHFKNIELLKVNKYYFSKSETIEASALYENKKVPVIIKVQRFNKILFFLHLSVRLFQ